MKTIFTLRAGLLLAFILALSVQGHGQTAGDYRTTGSATTMSSITGWETYNGSAWVTATYAPCLSNSTVIQSGTTSTSTAVTLAAANPLIRVNQIVTGTGVPVGTIVSAISGTSLTLSQATTTSTTTSLTFSEHFNIGSVTTTSSSANITLPAANPAIVAGMGVTGGGAPNGATVSSISGTALVLSAAIGTGGTNQTLTFYTKETTATTTANSNSITLNAANSLVAVGMNVASGVNGLVPFGSIVTAVSGTTVTLSMPVSTTYSTGVALVFGYNIIPNLYVNHNTNTSQNCKGGTIGNVIVDNSATLSVGGAGSTAFTFICSTLKVAAAASAKVTSNGSNLNNVLVLNGGIAGNVIDNSGTIDFQTSIGAGTTKTNITFTTPGNTTVTGAGTTTFNNIVVNMGGVKTNTVDIQSLITMATAAAIPTLTLTTGTFKLSSASTITPFGGNCTTTNNAIPTLAGLHLNNAGANFNWGTADATASTAGMQVRGNLTIDNGNLQVKARYDGAGVGYLTINGGSLSIPTITITNSTAAMFSVASSHIVAITGGTINIASYNTASSPSVLDRDIAINSDFLGGTFNISTPSPNTVYFNGGNKKIKNLSVATGSSVTIANATTIEGETTISAGATLSVLATKTLTNAITGTINNSGLIDNLGTITNTAGNIILESTASKTGYLLSSSSVDNVTQQRYLSSNQRGWRLLSNPLATTTYGDVATNSTTPITLGNGTAKTYDSGTNTWTISNTDDTQNWVSKTAITLFVRGISSEVTSNSYSVTPPSNVTLAIKGLASNVAPGTVNTTAETTGKYYLVANPYTAPVSVRSILLASTGLSNTISYYNPTIGSDGGNTTTGLIGKWGGYDTPTVSGTVGSATDVVIPPMGAFFVQALDNTIGTINVPKTAIFTGTPAQTGTYNHKTAQGKVAAANALNLEITSGSTYYDSVALRFKEVGTAGSNIDFGKLPNTVLDAYSINGSNKMAVSELELAAQSIPLGITSTIQKSYSLKVAENSIPAGYEAVLVDTYLNKNTLMTPGTDYAFAIDSNPASQGDTRFAINLKTTGALSVVENELDAKIQLWPNPAKGQVNITNGLNKKDGAATIEISNVNGQVVHSQKSNPGSTTTIQTNNWATGVYILKASNNGTQTTKKLIIQ